MAGFHVRMQRLSRRGGMARKRPARSRRQHPPSAQPPLDRRMVRQQRVQRSVVRLGMEHPVRQTGASRMGPDHRRPAPPPILRSAARSRRRLLARHALPPLVALVASRRHERKQRRRYAFLESVAQPRTDRRLQRHAQPLLQRIRLPVVPRIRLRPAFRPRRARLGHRIGGDDGPPARRRFRQHAHPPIPRRRILARTRFPHVPLHEPRFAGRRHQDRHRGAPVRQTLLLGIALLAAQRLLARGFVGQPRLVRPLEGATLFRPPGLRRHPRIAPCRGKHAECPPCVGPPQNGPGQTPDNGHGHGRRPPLGKHPQPNRRTQCQSERLFGRHFRTLARLRPQSGDRRRGIHDRRTPLRQHRIFRLSKRA